MASAQENLNTSSLRASTWSTPVVLGGLSFLLVWRSAPLLGNQWCLALPVSLILVVVLIFPELFLLLYPLITRRRESPGRLGMPRPKRVLIEAAIAVPTIIGCATVISFAQLVISRLSPGTSVVPEPFEQMGRSPGGVYVYGSLLTAVLLGPIAEEVFFRGFLLNAFCRRMPVSAALLLQSVIFGIVHFYTAQAIAAAFLGLVLGLVYLWRKTILTPFLVHAGYNALFALSILTAMHAYANGPALGVGFHESETECVIKFVAPGSPADQAGLSPGDKITHVNRQPIQDPKSLVRTLSSCAPGDVVSVQIFRDGEIQEIPVRLAKKSSISWTQGNANARSSRVP